MVSCSTKRKKECIESSECKWTTGSKCVKKDKPVQQQPVQQQPVQQQPVQQQPVQQQPVQQQPVQQQQKKCKDGQVFNPLTGRCINKNGALYNKLLRDKVIQKSPTKQQPLPKTPSPVKQSEVLNKKDCKNNETFLNLENVNNILKPDFIKLHNGFCYSIEELNSLLDSNTFFNINPHRTDSVLFDLEKDKEELKKAKLYDKVLKYMKTSQSQDKDKNKDILNILNNNIDLLYCVCKLGVKLTFDNLYSHSTSSEKFNLSILEISKFNLSFDKKPINIKDIFMNLKHPKTQKTVHSTIDECNRGESCIHGVGRSILETFIYYFMKLEQQFKIEYDISKGKTIFTKIIGNTLYFKQINSDEVPSNGPVINLLNILTTPDIFKKSSLFKNNKEHLRYKCEKFNKVCFNKEDLYLYTNDDNVNNWCDLPSNKIIHLEDKYCFSLDYLLEYMTNKLNSSNMNNPSPSYPINPFTNKILTIKDLKKIKKMLLLSTQTNKVPFPTKIFLEDETFWISDIRNFNIYNVIDKFEKNNLRYKRINNKDSQENYTGYWTSKLEIISNFEKHLKNYIDTNDKKYLDQINKLIPEVITYSNLKKYSLYNN
jgi:hypothetical protein